MMGSFVRDCMLPGLGMCAVVALVAVFVVWLGHVINSVARSADALERIADALENGENTEAEDAEGKDAKEEGGAK